MDHLLDRYIFIISAPIEQFLQRRSFDSEKLLTWMLQEMHSICLVHHNTLYMIKLMRKGKIKPMHQQNASTVRTDWIQLA
jgi:hypothetical protein